MRGSNRADDDVPPLECVATSHKLDRGDSRSQYVARALDSIDKSGLPYQLTPTGTIIERERE